MAIPPKKGLVAQFHWLKGSALVNINGGHFEGYIRRAGLGSVPKIANTSTFLLFIYSDPSGRNHYYLKGSLHHSLTGWYVLRYWLLFRFKSQGGLRV